MGLWFVARWRGGSNRLASNSTALSSCRGRRCSEHEPPAAGFCSRTNSDGIGGTEPAGAPAAFALHYIMHDCLHLSPRDILQVPLGPGATGTIFSTIPPIGAMSVSPFVQPSFDGSKHPGRIFSHKASWFWCVSRRRDSRKDDMLGGHVLRYARSDGMLVATGAKALCTNAADI